MPTPSIRLDGARLANLFAGVLPAMAVASLLMCPRATHAGPSGGPEIAVSVNGHPHSQSDQETDLGEVLVGKASTIRLRIVNSGDETLHITAIRFAGNDRADFQLSDPDDSFSVAPTSILFRGKIMEMLFTPSHEGTEIGEMNISNDSATATFKLRFRATGVVRPVLQLSVDGTVIDNGGTFDFGSITRNQAQSGTTNRPLELKNVGNLPLSITSRSSTDKFGVDSFTFPNSAFTLAPDQARISTLFFGVFGTTVGPGPREGELSIVTNAGSDPFTMHLKVNVLGPRLDVRMNDVSLLSTGLHDFGAVTVGQTAAATLTISSFGSEPLTGQLDIQSFGATQAYQLGAPVLTFSLAPGETFTSPLTVTPAAAGQVTASLLVTSNAGSFAFQLVTNGIEAIQLRDCNRNGVDDATDLSAGTSRDCNANNVPDECEPDSDGNGIIDACETAPPPPGPGSPTAPLTPGTPDNGATTRDGDTTQRDGSKIGSNQLDTANDGSPEGPDAVPTALPGPCGFGSAAMLPMMAVALCGMRSGKRSAR